MQLSLITKIRWIGKNSRFPAVVMIFGLGRSEVFLTIAFSLACTLYVWRPIVIESNKKQQQQLQSANDSQQNLTEAVETPK